MNRWATSTVAVALIPVLLVLSGCGEPVTDDELFDQARKVNFTFKAAVAEVQQELYDGEWRVHQYGDSPRPCGDEGFDFRMGRTTPEGWHIEDSPASSATKIGQWLADHGWTDIATRTYTDGITDVVIEARKHDAHVARLTVDVSPGKYYDSITIRTNSTCEPGDPSAIYAIQYPGWPTEEPTIKEQEPAIEHPSTNPSFGYTADGKRRFWPESE